MKKRFCSAGINCSHAGIHTFPDCRRPLFLILLIFTVIFHTQAETAKGLKFADAARLAVESSSDLKNEYAAKVLREGAWLWGMRAYLPRLSVSASEDDRVSEIGADSFYKNYSLNMEQLIWDGGRLSLSRKMEKAELDLAGSRIIQMASDIAEAAVSAYRDVLLGRAVLAIQEKTLESLEEQHRILKLEAELGLIRPSDLVDAGITVAMTRLEILSLSLDLEDAETSFAEMLGLEKLPALSEMIDTRKIVRMPAAIEACAMAESRNRELAVLRYSISMRQAELKAATLSWAPSLRLTGSFGISGKQYPLTRYNWSVGLSVDFSAPWLSGNFGAVAGKDPPYDRNARMQQTLTPAPDPASSFSSRSAQLALNMELTRYEAAVKEIHKSAERALRKIEVLDKRRSLALDALQLQAEKYRLAELKLSLGELTRLELMEARLDYAKREASAAEAAAAVLQAERELERLIDIEPGGLSVFTKEGVK